MRRLIANIGEVDQIQLNDDHLKNQLYLIAHKRHLTVVETAEHQSANSSR